MVKKVFSSLFKNSVIRMILALAVVGMISGYALVFVYTYAMPKITENIEGETQRAIANIFPAAGKIEKEKDVFKAFDKKGDLLGYAFLAEGNGYQGSIKLLAGIDSDLKELTGIEVLESQETPGLGAEIRNAKFKDQFKQLSVGKDIEYVKNRKPQKANQIEAITGATISSRAVVNILNKRIEEIKKDHRL
ncbi:MAG: RnfABCDGE type electron transport complex subunit G [Candidatus Omnitrophota bacterium]